MPGTPLKPAAAPRPAPRVRIELRARIEQQCCTETDCDPAGPDGAAWSEWTPWSECSKTCFHHVDAVGLRRRFRSCNHTDDSASCGGDEEEHEPCNLIHCPGTPDLMTLN